MSFGRDSIIRSHSKFKNSGRTRVNPSKLLVRMDRETGDLWLTEEKYRQPIKRIANITQHVYLALCADLVVESGTKRVERDVKFADGSIIKITLEEVEPADVTINPAG